MMFGTTKLKAKNRWLEERIGQVERQLSDLHNEHDRLYNNYSKLMFLHNDTHHKLLRVQQEARKFGKSMLKRQRRIDAAKLRADKAETAIGSLLFIYRTSPKDLGAMMNAVEGDVFGERKRKAEEGKLRAAAQKGDTSGDALLGVAH